MLLKLSCSSYEETKEFIDLPILSHPCFTHFKKIVGERRRRGEGLFGEGQLRASIVGRAGFEPAEKRKGKRQRGLERLGNKIMEGREAENPGARNSLLMALPLLTCPFVLRPPADDLPEMGFLPSAPKVGQQAKLDSLSRESRKINKVLVIDIAWRTSTRMSKIKVMENAK